MSQTNHRSKSWLLFGVLILLSILVLSPPILDILLEKDYLSITFPLDGESYSTLVNAIGSLILTFALVFLYRQQVRTLQKQEEWMEADHTPDVSVDRWAVNKNMLEVDLTNPGNGAAKNLKIEIFISDVYGGFAEERITISSGGQELFGTDITSRMIPAQESETISYETREPIIVKLEINSRSLFPRFGDGREYEDTFTEILNLLCHGEAEFIDYEIAISYDYVKRGKDSTLFWGGMAEIEPSMRLEDIIVESEVDESIQMLVIPDNRKEV